MMADERNAADVDGTGTNDDVDHDLLDDELEDEELEEEDDGTIAPDAE